MQRNNWLTCYSIVVGVLVLIHDDRIAFMQPTRDSLTATVSYWL